MRGARSSSVRKALTVDAYIRGKMRKKQPSVGLQLRRRDKPSVFDMTFRVSTRRSQSESFVPAPVRSWHYFLMGILWAEEAYPLYASESQYVLVPSRFIFGSTAADALAVFSSSLRPLRTPCPQPPILRMLRKLRIGRAHV